MATPTVNTMPTEAQRNAYDILQRNARTKNTAAAAAAEATKAAAEVAKAKATAPAASVLSRFNPFKG